MGVEEDKRAAAELAVEEVRDGMLVGLGTGTTAAYLLPATAEAARRLGLDLVEFRRIDRLDLAIDGADQVGASGWLIKGGGAAHTREKVVATAADRFVVVVSANKLVDALSPPVPLELLDFGLDATLRRVARLGPVRLRDAALSPDGGVIADYLGPIGDPAELARALDETAGIVDHGLFPPSLVSEVIVGRDGRAQRAS